MNTNKYRHISRETLQTEIKNWPSQVHFAAVLSLNAAKLMSNYSSWGVLKEPLVKRNKTRRWFHTFEELTLRADINDSEDLLPQPFKPTGCGTIEAIQVAEYKYWASYINYGFENDSEWNQWRHSREIEREREREREREMIRDWMRDFDLFED